MGSTSKIIRRPVQVLLVVPRQRSLAFPSDQLSRMDVSQREQALSCLVNLLILAAAGAAQEVNNDQC